MTVLADTSPPRVASLQAAGAGERWAAALCLVQCSEPFFNAVAQSQGLTEAPGYARFAWAPVYLFLAWAVWRDARAALSAALRAPMLSALLALAFVSALWSIDPEATLRRSVWLSVSMLFGLYLAWRHRWPSLLDIAARGWCVMIAGAAAMAIFAPSIGVMTEDHPGAWAGLWTHKNMMGGIMALGVPIGVAAGLTSGRRIWFAMAGAAFLMVLMSTSKTALLVSFLGLGVLGAGMIARRGPMFAIVISFGAAVAALAAASLILLAPDMLVGLIGRDVTLTGRTDIWAACLRAIAARPWLGYGYGAFWVDQNGPAFYVREAVGWLAPSAHNGWLDLALSVGRVGVALFAAQFAITLWRSARAVGDATAGLWAPAFCGAFALYSLSESHVLEANNIFWVLYVAVSARLALDKREERIA